MLTAVIELIAGRSVSPGKSGQEEIFLQTFAFSRLAS